MPIETDDLRAADGRVPGRRGLATRQRLLDETAAQLAKTGFRELKVIDIARDAGTSPATFYQYFADVEAAILALAEQMVDTSPLVTTIESSPWDAKPQAAAAATVDVFLDFFEEYQDVLRVIGLLTSEGDERFVDVRARILRPAAAAMGAVVSRFRSDGDFGPGLDAAGHAGVLVAALAHLSSRQAAFEQFGIDETALRASLVDQLHAGVTGRPVGSP